MDCALLTGAFEMGAPFSLTNKFRMNRRTDSFRVKIHLATQLPFQFFRQCS